MEAKISTVCVIVTVQEKELLVDLALQESVQGKAKAVLKIWFPSVQQLEQDLWIFQMIDK